MTSQPPRVAVISLGGTIACAPTAGGGLIPTNDPTELLGTAAGYDTSSVPWSLTDSTEITFDDLQLLAQRCKELERDGYDGIVITQGTDTLEESVWALALLNRTHQPVVFTGAMRSPASPGSDAEANLLAALATSVLPELADATTGAVLVMNNQIHSARWVQKTHTQNTDAFHSGDAGVLGVITEGTPVLLRRDLPLPTTGLKEAPLAGSTKAVALLAAGLDQDTALVDAVPGLGYSGLVIEGVGGGHVSGRVADALGRVADTIPVVFAARPRSGAVLTSTYGSPGAELDLIRRGCIPAGFLPAPKARILLTLLLRAGHNDPADLFSQIAQPLAHRSSSDRIDRGSSHA